MAGIITLSTEDWTALRLRLKLDYNWKPSVFAISSVMCRELGFTTRLHHEWVVTEVRGTKVRGHTRETVCLDFWDDHLETLFRLKYADWIR